MALSQSTKRSLRWLSIVEFESVSQVPKTLTFTEQPSQPEMSPVWAVAAALLVGLAAGFALRSPKVYETPQA